jgi:hypothetical protein
MQCEKALHVNILFVLLCHRDLKVWNACVTEIHYIMMCLCDTEKSYHDVPWHSDVIIRSCCYREITSQRIWFCDTENVHHKMLLWCRDIPLHHNVYLWDKSTLYHYASLWHRVRQTNTSPSTNLSLVRYQTFISIFRHSRPHRMVKYRVTSDWDVCFVSNHAIHQSPCLFWMHTGQSYWCIIKPTDRATMEI